MTAIEAIKSESGILSRKLPEVMYNVFANAAIEFAKYHVQEALKQAADKAELIYGEAYYSGISGKYELSDPTLDKGSILNSYDLNQIK